MLVIFFSLTYFIFLYFQKKDFLKKLDNLIHEKKITFILVLSFSFLIILNENILNIKNTFNFNKNIFALTKLSDSQFLSKKYQDLFQNLRKSLVMILVFSNLQMITPYHIF